MASPVLDRPPEARKDDRDDDGLVHIRVRVDVPGVVLCGAKTRGRFRGWVNPAKQSPNLCVVCRDLWRRS